MPAFTISAAVIRLLLSLCIFLLGFFAANTFAHPKQLKKDLSTALSDHTLTLKIPNHVNATIAADYLPIGLRERSRETLFWCALLTLAAGGAYIVGKFKDHVFAQLYALDEGAKNVPRGEKLRFHLNGVRDLDFVGWVNAVDGKDTYMACFVALMGFVGAFTGFTVPTVMTWTSDNILEKIKDALVPGSIDGTTFGSEKAHGSYNLESWSCQIAPLIIDTANATSSEGAKRVFEKACRDGRVPRYLLLTALPLTVLVFATAWWPERFTLNFGGQNKSGWMAVPLEEDESEDEDDPLAGFGSNAREQWLMND